MLSEKLLELSATDEAKRLIQINKAWNYYLGKIPDYLTVARDNVKTNLAKLLVNKSVSYLFGKSVEFDIDPAKQTEEEDFLNDVWDSNKKPIFLKKLAQNGAISGHCFVKIIDQKPFPRLVVLDSANVRVIWNPKDYEEVWAYVIQFDFIEEGKAKVFRQRFENDGGKWLIIEEVAEPPQLTWRLESQGVWNYDFAPIVDCQNLPLTNSYYGLADLDTDVLNMLDAFNYNQSNIQKIIRHHAHPKTWVRGASAGDLRISPDEVIFFPNPQAELHNLEMTSDLQSAMRFKDDLKSQIHELTRIPEIATRKVDTVGALSGRALRILYEPLIELTEDKRTTYETLLEEVCRRVLLVSGKRDVDISVRWPEIVPIDPQEEAQTAMLLEQVGVSRETALKRLGFNAEEEAKKKKAELEALGEGLLAYGEGSNEG